MTNRQITVYLFVRNNVKSAFTAWSEANYGTINEVSSPAQMLRRPGCIQKCSYIIGL